MNNGVPALGFRAAAHSASVIDGSSVIELRCMVEAGLFVRLLGGSAGDEDSR